MRGGGNHTKTASLVVDQAYELPCRHCSCISSDWRRQALSSKGVFLVVGQGWELGSAWEGDGTRLGLFCPILFPLLCSKAQIADIDPRTPIEQTGAFLGVRVWGYECPLNPRRWSSKEILLKSSTGYSSCCCALVLLCWISLGPQ